MAGGGVSPPANIAEKGRVAEEAEGALLVLRA